MHVYMLDMPPRQHVALRPRRCKQCGAAVLLDVDGTTLEDDARRRHPHDG